MGIIAKNEENIDDIIKKARVIELNSSSYESDCHKLTKIKLDSNGIITLEISSLTILTFFYTTSTLHFCAL